MHRLFRPKCSLFVFADDDAFEAGLAQWLRPGRRALVVPEPLAQRVPTLVIVALPDLEALLLL